MTDAELPGGVAKRFENDPVGYVQKIIGADPDTWQADVLRDIVSNQRIAQLLI